MADFLFVLSKLAWLLLAPASLLVLALLAGAALWWRDRGGIGGRVMALAAVVTAAVAVLPAGDWLLHPLEDRFPPPAAEPAHVDGIVVLGGAIDPERSAIRGRPVLNAHAERMSAFAGLARRHPEARLLFTGGSGALRPGLAREADVARRLLAELGIDPGRLMLERESRNTWENAVLSAAMVDPRPGETWLLVTSAMHMPRSVGIFRRVGWEVTAWPVAYQTGRADIGLARHLDQLDDAFHEWAGLIAYHLMGRTDSWFPAP